jgi:hypothetical protein
MVSSAASDVYKRQKLSSVSRIQRTQVLFLSFRLRLVA